MGIVCWFVNAVCVRLEVDSWELDRAVACCSLTIAAAGADWNEDERLTGCVPAGKGIGSHLCVS